MLNCEKWVKRRATTFYCRTVLFTCKRCYIVSINVRWATARTDALIYILYIYIVTCTSILINDCLISAKCAWPGSDHVLLDVVRVEWQLQKPHQLYNVRIAEHVGYLTNDCFSHSVKLAGLFPSRKLLLQNCQLPTTGASPFMKGEVGCESSERWVPLAQFLVITVTRKLRQCNLLMRPLFNAGRFYKYPTQRRNRR